VITARADQECSRLRVAGLGKETLVEACSLGITLADAGEDFFGKHLQRAVTECG